MSIPLNESPYPEPMPGLSPEPSGLPLPGPGEQPGNLPGEPERPKHPFLPVPPGDAPREGLWL